jgi:hypothetical protein
MAAILFPANPAGQTPVNTFSPTSTPLANTSNSFTYTWNGTAWTSAPAGGGGGGTVTSVSGTLPISVATGTTTPVISIAAATAAAAGSIEIATLAEAAAGTDATRALTPESGVPKDAAGMTGAALIPGGNDAARPSPVTGMFRYNSQSGTPVSLEYYDGAAWSPVGGGTAATLAEAAAGTINTKFSSPQTAVPKDAAGMTGAALLPTGTNAQRTAIASPVAGMTRFNTDYTPDSLEVYDGAAWKQVAYVPVLGTLTDLIPTNGSVLPAGGTYENIIINAGVTVTVPAICQLRARTSIQVNGTVNVGTAWPGGSPAGTATSAGTAAVSPNAGQGIGQGGKTYGYSATISGTGGVAATFVVDTGSGGGSGGGAGGGGLVFICSGPITVGAAAVINAEGATAYGGAAIGGTLGVQIPGGGGGSGGLIYLESDTSITLAGTSALSVAGGNGFGGFAGGSRTAFGAGGGGGGGGGYIILSSPNTTSVPANFNVSGGAAGADFAGAPVGSPSFFGGYGGSFAGSGGDPGGGAAGAWALPGNPGLVLYNVYL